MPRVIEVIQSEVSRGDGRRATDVCRRVIQYHSTDGEFLAENDCWPSFETLVETVQKFIKADMREDFAKAILEPEPIL